MADCIGLKITEQQINSLEIVPKINGNDWQTVQINLDVKED